MKAQKSDPSAESVYITDAKDQVVRTATRDEMRKKGLLHRVTYLLVFNSQGQILVQTRTMQKDWYPGYVDLAAGGVVTAGESYAESAHRELQEELGIRPELRFEFKMYFEDNNSGPPAKSWGAVYSCLSEGPFVLQPEEVDEVCFMTIAEALRMPSDRTTPDSRQVLIAYIMGDHIPRRLF